MTNKRRLGSEYETLAAEYLTEHGYKILERNFFIRGGELDIVAESEKTVIFVEVRFRNEKVGGTKTALESIDHNKQIRICRCATYYLQRKGLFDTRDVRFDVIGVSEQGSVTHIINAFEYHV